MSITNDGRHIEHISRETICEKHSSSKGVPCWAIEGGSSDTFVVGVCGSRILKAGFNGKVSPLSLKRSAKRSS